MGAGRRHNCHINRCRTAHRDSHEFRNTARFNPQHPHAPSHHTDKHACYPYIDAPIYIAHLYAATRLKRRLAFYPSTARNLTRQHDDQNPAKLTVVSPNPTP